MTPLLRNLFIAAALLAAGYCLYDCARYHDCFLEHREESIEHIEEVCK